MPPRVEDLRGEGVDVSPEKDLTTEKLLRDGDALLDTSQELLRDLDEQLRANEPGRPEGTL